MPKSKAKNVVDFNFITVTYVLGLYGGLVSGLLVSLATTTPSNTQLWYLGVALVLIGVILFFTIHQLLGKKKSD